MTEREDSSHLPFSHLALQKRMTEELGDTITLRWTDALCLIQEFVGARERERLWRERVEGKRP